MISFSAAIAPILKANCTASGCHGNQYNQTASAYTRLKATTAGTTACANMPRIVVGSGATSLAVRKMLGTAGCGTRMPQVNNVGCTGNNCVPAADIAKVSQWIDQGALNN